MIHIYDVTMMTSQGCNDFQLFNLGKTTRNYYTPVTCDHARNIGKYLIQRQTERHIMKQIIIFHSFPL